MHLPHTHTSQDPMVYPGGFSQETDKRSSVRIQRETVSTAAVFAACIVALLLSKVINPAFGSWQQLQTILMLASFLIVIAYGQGLAILIGGLDLSVPSVVTLGGVMTAVWTGASPDGNVWWQLVAVLLLCGCVGVVNGIGIVYFKVPAFIMTLASDIIVYSICLGATGGAPSGAAPHALVTLMSGRAGNTPIIIIFVLVFCALAVLVQRKTSFGRSLYALGSNPLAARIAGLPVSRLTIATYIFSSVCAGLAGMMLVGYSNGATLRMGEAYLLPSIAAVVIGGSSILGGRGTFLGTIGGAILLTILDMIITSLGLAQGWRTMIEGGLILVVVLLQHEQALDYIRLALFRRRSAVSTE